MKSTTTTRGTAITTNGKPSSPVADERQWRLGRGKGHRRWFVALGMGLFSLDAAVAHAGRVTPGVMTDPSDPGQDDCNDPRNDPDKKPEVCADDERPGDVTLDFHFRAPPLQQQIDQATQQMTIASRIICDASDGYLRIKRINFTVGDEQRRSGDIWWSPQPGQGHSSGGYPLRSGSGHIAAFGYEWAEGLRGTTMRGTIMAHELGHAIFGIGDQYGTYHRGKLWGPSFDGQGVMGRFRSLRNRDLAFDQLPGPDTERRHSILQGATDLACTDPATGLTLMQTNPVEWAEVPCLTNADCDPAVVGSFTLCPSDPSEIQLMSELSTEASGYDALRGSLVAQCPAPLPGDELVVAGYYVRKGPCGADADADGDELDSYAFEECEDSVQASKACDFGDTSNTMPCTGCTWDRSPCALDPATPGSSGCGDGVVTGTEQCDDADPSSDTLACSSWGLGGGDAVCVGCVYDRSACALPADPRVGTDLEGIPGALYETVEVRDASDDEESAYHTLVLDLLLRGDTEGTLVVGVDAGDFVGGTAGEYHLLAVWDVEWDAPVPQPDGSEIGAIRFVDSAPYDPNDPATFPELVLGSETQVSTHMQTDPGAGRKHALPTGAFANGAPLLRVRLVADHWFKGAGLEANGDWLTLFKAGARHGVGPTGTDIPQRGPVTDDHEWRCGDIELDKEQFCRMAYNQQTERFELTDDAFDQVRDECRRRQRCLDDPQCVQDTCGYAPDAYQKCMGTCGVQSPPPPPEFCAAVCQPVYDALDQCQFQGGALDLQKVINEPFDFMRPDWTQLFASSGRDYGLAVRSADFTELPDPDPIGDPNLCPDPQFPAGFTVERPVELVLALDRSLSMKAEIPLIAPRTRLDFAKAATRALLQVHATDATDASRIGLVWFNQDADIIEPDAGSGPMRRLVRTVTNSNTQVSADELSGQLLDSSVPPPDDETPQPSGNTAIGEALHAAHGLFTKGALPASCRLSCFSPTAKRPLFTRATPTSIPS